MTGGFSGPGGPGSGPFDEFLACFFGGDPRRPVQRVDIGRLLLDGRLERGRHVRVDQNDGSLTFGVTDAQPAPAISPAG